MTKHTEFCDGIKNEIVTSNGGKEGECGTDLMKIRFNTDVDLPLNELLKLHILTIVIRSVFEQDSKFSPQISLDEYLYES